MRSTSTGPESGLRQHSFNFDWPILNRQRDVNRRRSVAPQAISIPVRRLRVPMFRVDFQLDKFIIRFESKRLVPIR